MLLRFFTAKWIILNLCEKKRCRGKLRMLIAFNGKPVQNVLLESMLLKS